SSRFITLRLNYQALTKYLLASFLAIICIRPMNIEVFMGVLIKLAIGGVIYLVAMTIIDRRTRQRVRVVLKFKKPVKLGT
ncbi:MAG: hypothetical protein O7G31_11860, partial [Calditrichaeota bacterium]|nr:hypothetical protein [Calditrichota bacterium]